MGAEPLTTGYPRPDDSRTPEWRSLTRRMADLCKADPAAFAAVVRESDRLQRLGLSRDEAHERALGGL